MLLTAQVVRGSVGSPNVMVGDRLELDACDLELVCRHCQRKVARTEFSTDDRELGRPELTPLGECGGAVELEIVS